MYSRTHDGDTLEVKIISLIKTPAAKDKLQSIFFDRDALVTVHNAVDLRKVSPWQAYRNGLLGESSVLTILEGRKWHHELTTMGATGLLVSVRMALSGESGAWLLLCEDDVVPNFTLADEVDNLRMAHANGFPFDAAIFGPTSVNPQKWKPDCLLPSDRLPYDWVWLSGTFFGTHCVLWSPEGRRKAVSFLGGKQSVQLDMQLSLMHAAGLLKIIVQTGVSSADQSSHVSTIQLMNGCRLCDVAPLNEFHSNSTNGLLKLK